MKKFITIVFLLNLLCGTLIPVQATSAFSITVGMTRNEIEELFSGYIKEESTSNNETYSNGTNKIKIYYSDNIAQSFNFQVSGSDRSTLDFLVPDWSITYDKLIWELLDQKIAFRCFSSDYNIPAHESSKLCHIVFNGSVNSFPVQYSLLFIENQSLSEVEISPVSIDSDLFGFVCITSSIVNYLGMPQKGVCYEDVDYSEPELIEYLTDSLIWEQNGNHYDLSICHHIECEVEDQSASITSSNYGFTLSIKQVRQR